MKIAAPSKINLYLRICGTLPNGYHEIETLFVPLADPCDELDIEFIDDGRRDIHVSSDVPLPADGDNLCGRAARAVCSALGIAPSVRIFIRKRIPVAAGMGGGSSDAAAVILAAQKQYGPLPDGGHAAALACGADVPLFLHPVPSIGRGIGDRLEPVEDLCIPPVLICPMHFPVSTPWGYRHIKPTGDRRTLDDLLRALRTGDFEKTATLLRNDLAPALWDKFPVLHLRKEQLLDAGALAVQITGSGPTLYALFPEEKTKETARRMLSER